MLRLVRVRVAILHFGVGMEIFGVGRYDGLGDFSGGDGVTG